MAPQLDELDEMLLGEEHHQKAAGKTNTKHDSTQKGADDDCSNPLIATAGTLVRVDHSGNEIAEQQGTKEALNAHAKVVPKKRGAHINKSDSSDDGPLTKKHSAKKAMNTATNGKSTILNNDAQPGMPPPKKRASIRKNAESPVVKTEDIDEIEDASACADGESSTPSPKKRGTTKKAGKGDPDNSTSPTKSDGTPRKRAAPKGALAPPRGIPSSWETADAADRMLVTMKNEGQDWSTIREKWTIMTGTETCGSTLPNRYNRIKSNLMHLKDGEATHLLAAKKEAEAELWAHIATKMEARGTEKYPTAFLQKKYKALEDGATNAGMSVDAYVENNLLSVNAEANGTLTEEDIKNGKAIDAYVQAGGDASESQ